MLAFGPFGMSSMPLSELWMMVSRNSVSSSGESPFGPALRLRGWNRSIHVDSASTSKVSTRSSQSRRVAFKPALNKMWEYASLCTQNSTCYCSSSFESRPPSTFPTEQPSACLSSLFQCVGNFEGNNAHAYVGRLLLHFGQFSHLQARGCWVD